MLSVHAPASSGEEPRRVVAVGTRWSSGSAAVPTRAGPHRSWSPTSRPPRLRWLRIVDEQLTAAAGCTGPDRTHPVRVRPARPRRIRPEEKEARAVPGPDESEGAMTRHTYDCRVSSPTSTSTATEQREYFEYASGPPRLHDLLGRERTAAASGRGGPGRFIKAADPVPHRAVRRGDLAPRSAPRRSLTARSRQRRSCRARRPCWSAKPGHLGPGGSPTGQERLLAALRPSPDDVRPRPAHLNHGVRRVPREVGGQALAYGGQRNAQLPPGRRGQGGRGRGPPRGVPTSRRGRRRWSQRLRGRRHRARGRRPASRTRWWSATTPTARCGRGRRRQPAYRCPRGGGGSLDATDGGGRRVRQALTDRTRLVLVLH
jgi:hypothetical protein